MSFKYKRLDKNDAAVLLIDHQTGLFNLVRDFEPIQFKNNVLALADSAKFFNLPTILTTSFDNGPNGPLLPEIIEMLNGCELSSEECKQYRAAILDVLSTKRSDLTKREDSIRQKLSDRNKKAEEYLLDEKTFIDEHMEETVQFLIMQGICKSQGEELSAILSSKVKYRKYSLSLIHI